GRNWGCIGDFPFLHFEACYYQAIEYAIARGLARVEAGAQGEHKIQRGYLPVETVSAHWIAHPNFAAAVADFLKREARAVREEGRALAELSPFRKDCGGCPPVPPRPSPGVTEPRGKVRKGTLARGLATPPAPGAS